MRTSISPAALRGFQDSLADVPDPRMARTRKHSLLDIMVIAVLATIADCDGW